MGRRLCHGAVRSSFSLAPRCAGTACSSPETSAATGFNKNETDVLEESDQNYLLVRQTLVAVSPACVPGVC